MNLGAELAGFDGIYNFRDYGGCSTRSGVRLKRGLLFRSGQHHAASDADLRRVAGLKLRSVVDLRGQSERQLSPCRRPPGFSAKVVHGGPDAGSDTPPHERAARNTRSRDEAVASMLRNYRQFPFSAPLVSAIRQYLGALEGRSGPSLVHCFAGKDRTGLAVAILHTLVGVHPDDVMVEYLRSNEAGMAERPFGMSREEIRKRYGRQLSEDAIIALVGVDEHYLQAAFEVITESFGGISGYSERILGVSALSVDRIVERIID